MPRREENGEFTLRKLSFRCYYIQGEEGNEEKVISFRGVSNEDKISGD